MEAKSSPLCLEFCPCLLETVPERDLSCAYLTHREQQHNSRWSQWLPFGVLEAPFSQCRQHMAAAEQHPRGLCGNIHSPETSTNHLPSGTARRWEASGECFPSHADKDLHFGVVLFNSFSYSNSLSTWLCISSLCSKGDKNPVTRRLLQSTSSSSSSSFPCTAFPCKAWLCH